MLYSNEGFESYQDLEIQGNYDLVTSAVIYDATFSGYNSIVLGTFSRSVAFFCPTKTSSVDNSDCYEFLKNQTSIQNESLVDQIESSRRLRCNISYELKREIVFKHSVLGLLTGLLSNNGAVDLIILTLNGISVWQYDPEKIIDLANKLFELRDQTECSKEHPPVVAGSGNLSDLTSFSG